MRNLHIYALAATGALALLIGWLTLNSVQIPDGLPRSDKFYHVIAFAALTFPTALTRPRWLIWAVPLFAAFGALIEIVQPGFGRSREFADFVADLIGIGLGVVAGFATRMLFLRASQTA